MSPFSQAKRLLLSRWGWRKSNGPNLAKVCEPIWAALEDKEVQWGYCSKDWPTNAKLMHDAGIDPYAVWIARTRECGASPWVSMRMNDNHDGWLPHGARVSDFYKKHPEWRMSPDYRGGQWWPYALDFVHQGR